MAATTALLRANRRHWTFVIHRPRCAPERRSAGIPADLKPDVQRCGGGLRCPAGRRLSTMLLTALFDPLRAFPSSASGRRHSSSNVELTGQPSGARKGEASRLSSLRAYFCISAFILTRTQTTCYQPMSESSASTPSSTRVRLEALSLSYFGSDGR